MTRLRRLLPALLPTCVLGLAAQDSQPFEPRDPGTRFVARMSAWLRAAAGGEAFAEARREAWLDVVRMASLPALAPQLAHDERLRELLGDALVETLSATRGTEPGPPALVALLPRFLRDLARRPETGQIDPWRYVHAETQPSVAGYRLLVRLVLDHRRFAAEYPDEGGLLAPWVVRDPAGSRRPELRLPPGTAVIALKVPPELELDDPTWSAVASARAREAARVAATWEALSHALRGLPRIDPDRIVLDCDRGTGPFGLRFLTYHSDRFAGALLRQPEISDGLRVESLANLSLGLIADSLGSEAAVTLAEKLDAVRPGSTRVFEGFDGKPIAAERPAYERWLAGLLRDGGKRRVVLAPNRDEDREAFWLGAKPQPPGRRGVPAPLVDAEIERSYERAEEAERGVNLVRIKAEGVTEVRVCLDDRLVDLQDPVDFVVNGVRVREKLGRSLAFACEQAARRRDPGLVYTTSVTLAVPRAE